jgi:hypothetical protein
MSNRRQSLAFQRLPVVGRVNSSPPTSAASPHLPDLPSSLSYSWMVPKYHTGFHTEPAPLLSPDITWSMPSDQGHSQVWRSTRASPEPSTTSPTPQASYGGLSPLDSWGCIIPCCIVGCSVPCPLPTRSRSLNL